MLKIGDVVRLRNVPENEKACLPLNTDLTITGIDWFEGIVGGEDRRAFNLKSPEGMPYRGWYGFRFVLVKASGSKRASGPKAEFSVRYAQTPKRQQAVADKVFGRMKRKMPKWLLDGIVRAALEEARTRVA